MKTRADRSAWDAEQLGDHRGLVSEVVAKHEDGTLLRLQAVERPINDITIDDARELVGREMVGEVQHFELGVPAPVASRMVDAHVREHALDPEVEPVRIAEVRQVTPRDHQRVLQSILGPVDIADDPSGDREQAIEASAHQVHEGDVIATLRREHEVSIHRRHSS